MAEQLPRLTEQAVADLLIDTAPYLSCDECFTRLDEFVEQHVRDPKHQDRAMTTHLAGCGACAEEAAALLELLSGP